MMHDFAIWFAAAIFFAGCLDARPPDGSARCGPARARCPRDYYCAGDGRCWRLGAGPDLSVAADLAADRCAGVRCDDPAPDRCHEAPACVDGACVAAVKQNGAICADATSACQLPGRCSDGVCGPVTKAPDGYQYDTSDYKRRCCGGQPARLDQSPNCGACDIKCADNFVCTNLGATNEKQYWCTCGGFNSACWSGCCALPDNVCSPSTCQDPADCAHCPAGSTCDASQPPHYYCHY